MCGDRSELKKREKLRRTDVSEVRILTAEAAGFCSRREGKKNFSSLHIYSGNELHPEPYLSRVFDWSFLKVATTTVP